jgi:hypothetical protein
VRGLTCWHQWRHDAVMLGCLPGMFFFRRIPLLEQITKHFVNICAAVPQAKSLMCVILHQIQTCSVNFNIETKRFCPVSNSEFSCL